MRPLRVAFVGASGTGKTTLAKFIEEKYGLPMNPVGSRSVAEAMGFASPYDVDKAGKRAEFQGRLLSEKLSWEAKHDSFVTDRTVADNIAYTMLHDIDAIGEAELQQMREGLARYTHIFYCPFSVHCKLGDDPARKHSRVYQLLYDVDVEALVRRFARVERVHVLTSADLGDRKSFVSGHLAGW